MGELYFQTGGRKIASSIGAFIAAAIAVFLSYWLVNNYNTVTSGVFWFVFVVIALCIWYAYDDILGAIKNKILFFEKGMEITNGFRQYTILIDDIKKVNMVEKTGGDYLLTFTFELRNGEFISIDSDEYDELPSLMKEYGKKFNKDWSFW